MSYTIDVHLSPEDVRTQMRADALGDSRAWRSRSHRCGSTTSAAAGCSRRSPSCPSTTRRGRNAALLEAHAPAIAELAKADTLVELGAGACDKTRVLLSALQEAGTLTRYVPFDVSDEFLRSAADTLSDEFTGLDIHLVIGDFHQHLAKSPPTVDG